MIDVLLTIRTIVPILLIMGLGFLSRKTKVLRPDDGRVLSAYVYYFALPALFIVNLAATRFTEEVIRFMFVGIIPPLLALAIFTLLHVLIRFSRDALYLLIVCTVFGSLSFFGIPFVMFAFPMEGEHLATLASASISPVSVTIAIAILELSRLEKSTVWEGVTHVVKRFSKNPLIISILLGILLSLLKIEIPSPISTSLHMLGRTTSAVAIFMLGALLYGREYKRKATAFKLSLLRIVFLPLVALITTRVFPLLDVERSVLVLMHGMPVAISMIVLSERYDFHKETIASLILLSSLGAGIYLNLWLLLLTAGIVV